MGQIWARVGRFWTIHGPWSRAMVKQHPVPSRCRAFIGTPTSSEPPVSGESLSVSDAHR